MSVLIDGIMLPKDENIYITLMPQGAVVTTEKYSYYGRPKVKEIPAQHGRLGDLDRLEQMFADIDNAPYSGFDGTEPFYSAEDAAQIIRLAPTIIEAEE